MGWTPRPGAFPAGTGLQAPQGPFMPGAEAASRRSDLSMRDGLVEDGRPIQRTGSGAAGTVPQLDLTGSIRLSQQSSEPSTSRQVQSLNTEDLPLVYVIPPPTLICALSFWESCTGWEHHALSSPACIAMKTGF